MVKVNKYARFEDETDDHPAVDPAIEADIRAEAKARSNVQGLSYDNQSPITLFFLTWISPLTTLGRRWNITFDDIPLPPQSNLTPYVVDKFNTQWQHTNNRKKDELLAKNEELIRQGIKTELPQVQKNRLASYEDYEDLQKSTKKRKNKPNFDHHPAFQTDKDDYANNANRIAKEIKPRWAVIDLFLMFKEPVIYSGLGELLFYFFSLFQPYIIKLLSAYFADYSEGVDHGVWYGIWLAFLLGFVSVATCAATLLKNHHQINLSSRCTVGQLVAIFDKSLRIAPYSIAHDSALSFGNISNMVSQDANVIHTTALFMHFVWSGPIAIALCLVLMYFDLGGPTTFVTFLLMALLIPFQTAIAAAQRYYRKKTLRLADERIKYETQLLNGIRVIKAYAFELVCRQKVGALRDAELRQHKRWQLVTWTSDIITYVYPLLTTYCAIAVYCSYTSASFDSSLVFVLLTYLNTLRLPISFLSNSIASIVDFHVASSRIAHFLSKEELPQREAVVRQIWLDTLYEREHTDEYYINMGKNGNVNKAAPRTSDIQNNNQNSLTTTTSDDVMIKFNHVDLYWSSFEQKPYQVPVLSNISLEVKRGERIVVVGSSGTGKTAIFQAIIGDLYPQKYKEFNGLLNISNLTNNNDNGTFSYNNTIDIVPADLIKIYSSTAPNNKITDYCIDELDESRHKTNPHIAYCAQQPFLLADTIRNNILLNSPLDSDLYSSVIEASALAPDLNILKEGDFTICGDSVGLSGGQQARVAFARMLYQSLYNNMDIAICDDVFAAVDANVGKTMFFKGIMGLLNGKTVLLSLNSHYDFLQHANKIMLIDTAYNDDGYYYKLHQKVMDYYKTTSNNADSYKGEDDDEFLLVSSNGSTKSTKKTLISQVTSDTYDDGASSAKQHVNNTSHNNNKSMSNSPIIKSPSVISTATTATQLDDVYNIARSNAAQYDVDDEGFRQPCGIVFYGNFQQLITFNHPLLQTFTFSSHAEEEKEIYNTTAETLSDGSAHKPARYGQIDEKKEAEQNAKLQHKIEGGKDDKSLKPSKSSAPSQARLPNTLYLDYFRGSRGTFGMWFAVVLFLAFSILSVICRTWSDYWLVQWANDSTSATPQPVSYWLLTTALAMFVSFALFFGQVATFVWVAIDASAYFHKYVLERLFHSATSYLDTTPMASMLSLIIKDTETIDMLLPNNMLYIVQQGLQLVGVLALSLFSSFWFVLLLIPLFLVIGVIRNGYHNTSVQVKRLEIGAVAPIQGLFNSIMRGTSSIRSYGLQSSFIKKFRDLTNRYVRVKVIMTLLERRFGFMLNALASAYVLGLSLLVVIFRKYLDANMSMLAISYSLRLTGSLQVTLRFHTQTTQSMTSVMRCRALEHIPQESGFYTDFLTKKMIKKQQPSEFANIAPKPALPPRTTRDGQLIDLSYGSTQQQGLYHWPWYGKIEFKNVSLRYRPELPIVLNNASFTINPRESVGLCAPTGAGKSTALAALFRFLSPVSGSIEIDGVDISMLGIGDLRSRLALVPQFPTLFSGTVRDNIDVCTRYTDEEIWHALQLVSMDSVVRQLEDGLYSEVHENGANFSASQRQLLCIARALLTQLGSIGDQTNAHPLGGSILIGDELSAACDLASDDLIQGTIRESFKHSTKLIIAHRLQSIIDLDKVLVLRRLNEDDIAGNVSSVAEFDVPYLLLNDPKSAFYGMCLATGVDGFIDLYNRAKIAFDAIKKRQFEEYGVVIHDPPQLINLDLLTTTLSPIPSNHRTSHILKQAVEEQIKNENHAVLIATTSRTLIQDPQELSLNTTIADDVAGWEMDLMSPDPFSAPNASFMYDRDMAQKELHQQQIGDNTIYPHLNNDIYVNTYNPNDDENFN